MTQHIENYIIYCNPNISDTHPHRTPERKNDKLWIPQTKCYKCIYLAKVSNDMEVIYALFETRQILGYLIYGMLHKLDCTAEGGKRNA